jgi:hypothetical protein
MPHTSRMPGEAHRRQQSRQFGIKLAKGLRDYARENKLHPETGEQLDERAVLEGAVKYLADQVDAYDLIDPTQVDDDRRN